MKPAPCDGMSKPTRIYSLNGGFRLKTGRRNTCAMSLCRMIILSDLATLLKQQTLPR